MASRLRLSRVLGGFLRGISAIHPLKISLSLSDSLFNRPKIFNLKFLTMASRLRLRRILGGFLGGISTVNSLPMKWALLLSKEFTLTF